MSACTCETIGYCTPCDVTRAEFLADHLGIDSVSHVQEALDLSEDEPLITECAWCRIRYFTTDMFVVGHNNENRWVCGPNCPQRPERPTKRERCQHNHVRIGRVISHPNKRFSRTDWCKLCGASRRYEWQKKHTVKDWS